MELSDNELYKHVSYWRFLKIKLRRPWFQFYELLITDPSLVGKLFRKWEKKRMLGDFVYDDWTQKPVTENWRTYQIPKYRFKESQTVRIKCSGKPCIGIVANRWIARSGEPCYEIQVNQQFFCFYESELQNTKLRICSKVRITEFKSRTLADGAYSSLTNVAPIDYSAYGHCCF